MSVIATHRVSIDLSDRKHQEQAAQAARLAESCSSSVERLKEESLGVPADQARRARMAFWGSRHRKASTDSPSSKAKYDFYSNLKQFHSQTAENSDRKHHESGKKLDYSDFSRNQLLIKIESQDELISEF